MTIIPAIIKPTVTNGAAVLNFIPKTWAMREPVQPPLPGNGIATNVASARWPSVLILWECFARVFSKRRVSKRSAR